jgi:hypothetical protein
MRQLRNEIAAELDSLILRSSEMCMASWAVDQARERRSERAMANAELDAKRALEDSMMFARSAVCRLREVLAVALHGVSFTPGVAKDEAVVRELQDVAGLLGVEL